MGNTLMSLLVKLGLDSAALDSGLGDAEKSSTKSSAKIAGSLNKIGGTMQQVGGIATAAFSLPIAMAANSAIKSASDLSESMNASNVVFGQAADKIKNFGEIAATQAGLSNRAFLQMGSQTGAMLQNFGMSQDAAAEETINLTKRAADMASVFNTDVATAMGAIQAGLRGETEPLRKFAVSMSASAVEAKALAMGLADQNGNISELAKSQASLDLIYDQTNKYAGDFINTAGGFANSTKIMSQELENLSASFGHELLPVATDVLKALLPILQSFNSMSPAMKETIVIILGVVAAAGPLIGALGTVITTIGSLITAFSAGGWAITALSAAGTFLSGTVLPALGAIMAAISLPVLALVAAVVLLGFTIYYFGRDAWNTLDMVGKLFTAILGRAWYEVKTFISNAFSMDWASIGSNIMQGIVNGINNGLNWVRDAAKNAANSAYESAKNILGIQSPSKVFAGVGKNMMLGMAQGIDKFANVPVNMTMNATGQMTPAAASVATPKPQASMADKLGEMLSMQSYGGPSAREIGRSVAESLMQMGVAQ